ncbi:hypothetical protein H920_04662 [Fukomys damarensis]|uniref:Uncharacterized protein n=1 Tax=Fukomys damarensis TaxID=885580 RepID=A0A091DS61_FUKDA|nr:hypothetical protein H920_04662 [Fukomys damarensis]
MTKKQRNWVLESEKNSGIWRSPGDLEMQRCPDRTRTSTPEERDGVRRAKLAPSPTVPGTDRNSLQRTAAHRWDPEAEKWLKEPL